MSRILKSIVGRMLGLDHILRAQQWADRKKL